MNESGEQISDYEALTRELRKTPGATEHAVKLITDGIEIEAFRETPAGKIIVGSAMRGMVQHLELVLDPNVSGPELAHAISELRVRHRLLVVIEETVAAGKAAGQRLTTMNSESTEENL
jgi:hypothetical protein